jgi:hypothetical protein
MGTPYKVVTIKQKTVYNNLITLHLKQGTLNKKRLLIKNLNKDEPIWVESVIFVTIFNG